MPDSPDAPISLYVTVPSEELARSIAHTLVNERLVACVNIVPAITSIYAWEGVLLEDAEVLMFAKTDRARMERAGARIVELHSYDVPCLLALPIVGGHGPYLDWLNQSRPPV